jgi:hypothetical protein
MSAVLNLHADIARELYLEYMVQQPGSAREAARAAIEGADIFVEEYAARTPDDPASKSKKLKGCRACYGSGGKIGVPCKVCKGVGKVAE